MTKKQSKRCQHCRRLFDAQAGSKAMYCSSACRNAGRAKNSAAGNRAYWQRKKMNNPYA